MEIELSDIASVIKVIDVVTKRGAFEGPEMADVGALRNRLSAFVEGHVKAAEEKAAEEKAAEGEDSQDPELEEGC